MDHQMDDFLKQLGKEIALKNKIKAMMKTDGWKILQGYFEKKRDHFQNIKSVGIKTVESNEVAMHKLLVHTTAYEIYDSIFKFINGIIIKGEESTNEKHRLEKEKKDRGPDELRKRR